MKFYEATAVHASAILAEQDISHRELENMLRSALGARHPEPSAFIWPRDIYDDNLVYSIEMNGSETLYQRSYSIADNEITLGDPVEVVAVTNYVPVTQAATESAVEIESEMVPLVEKAVKNDGTIAIKIIAPGHGSSGYYSPEVLKRDGPKVFTKGLHVYADHPSLSEESDRPERSVKDLLGALTSDARWEETGTEGPGLYAEARLRSDVAPLIEDLAPHIGMSIRALGKAEMGEVDGKQTRVITAIEQARSCDVVTVPGAGGKVLELMEAARQGMSPLPKSTTEQETPRMDKELEEARKQIETQQAQLDELKTWKAQQEARESETRLLSESRAVVVETLSAITLPQPTRDRLTETLTLNPPIKDNALDRDALAATVKEAAERELAYVASVSGNGKVQGMGGESSTDDKVPTLEESDKRIAEALKAI
jgi:hypothetical protein